MPERNPGVCCFRCRGRLLYLQNPQRIYKVNKKSSIYEFLFYSVLIAEVFKIKCAVLKNLQRQVALCEYLLSAAKHYPRKQPKKLGTILKIGRIDKKKKKKKPNSYWFSKCLKLITAKTRRPDIPVSFYI